MVSSARKDVSKLLSKNSKLILRAAKKSVGCKVSYAELAQRLNLSPDDVCSACNQLIDAKLAEIKYRTHYPGGPAAWGIILTERGRHRWKYILEKGFIFALKELLIPILVSLLTTLITLLVSGAIDIK